jgi:hypothetical protein
LDHLYLSNLIHELVVSLGTRPGRNAGFAKTSQATGGEKEAEF